MSLLKKIGGAIGSVARVIAPVARPILGAIPGIGTAAAIGLTAASMLGQRSSTTQGAISQVPPTLPGVGQMSMSMLPAIGGTVVRAGGALVTRGYRAAVTWCRRNPAWCAQVGGLGAVAAMVDSGQLPAPRRRRSRGISSRELRSYRRVHNVLADFCAPKARIKRKC